MLETANTAEAGARRSHIIPPPPDLGAAVRTLQVRLEALEQVQTQLLWRVAALEAPWWQRGWQAGQRLWTVVQAWPGWTRWRR